MVYGNDELMRVRNELNKINEELYVVRVELCETRKEFYEDKTENPFETMEETLNRKHVESIDKIMTPPLIPPIFPFPKPPIPPNERSGFLHEDSQNEFAELLDNVFSQVILPELKERNGKYDHSLTGQPQYDYSVVWE